MPVRLRAGMMFGFAAGLCFVWLALPEAALALDAVERLEIATKRAQTFEISVMRWKLAIACCALLLVGLPLLLRRLNHNAEGASNQVVGSRLEIARVSLLLFLALSSFASYYDFFRDHGGVEFKHTDVYHYYMGSKYFSEVGYFDLYHCTTRVLLEAGAESTFELPRVRDQRTLRIHTPETALAAANQCRRQFSGDRWRQFSRDVGWFTEKFQHDQWRAILVDHGYNPTPVWTAIGGTLAAHVPLQSAAFDWVIYGDRVMMIAAFLMIGWAFGFEVAALAAIVWGTGQHWSHSWIGDSMLRNLWLFGVVAGLCFVKRNMNFLGGAFLSLASLLRVFPIVFIAGFALRSWIGLRDGMRNEMDSNEDWRPAARRFGAGALTMGAVLLLWGSLTSEWGAVAYLEFLEKISVFIDQSSLNKLGLSSLIWRTVMIGTGHLVTGPEGQPILTPYALPWLPVVIRLGQLAVLIPAALMFWRGISRASGWEAATLGFALIPLLSDPANYYYSFVICGALLAGNRPRMQVYLMAAAVFWIANGLWFYRVPGEYLGAGAVAVLLPLAVLHEMSRENPSPASTRA